LSAFSSSTPLSTLSQREKLPDQKIVQTQSQMNIAGEEKVGGEHILIKFFSSK